MVSISTGKPHPVYHFTVIFIPLTIQGLTLPYLYLHTIRTFIVEHLHVVESVISLL